MNRSENFIIRLSPAERRLIDEAAEEAYTRPSTYARGILLKELESRNTARVALIEALVEATGVSREVIERVCDERG